MKALAMKAVKKSVWSGINMIEDFQSSTFSPLIIQLTVMYLHSFLTRNFFIFTVAGFLGPQMEEKILNWEDYSYLCF